MLLPIVLAIILTAIAVLHAWWGVGGHWPGRDERALADLVIGNASGRMPSPHACFAVAAAIMVGVGLVIVVCFARSPPPLDIVARLAYGLFATVLLLRGLAGFVPAIWRYSDGTTFQRVNVLYYSPLCLIIALGLGFSFAQAQ